ncbi:MAG: O-antigen ligase family protein [Candidatus Falkowbacteria bacterium]
MPRIKKIIVALICLYIFLIPLQTHWLYDQKLIGGESWQYGALKIYATELLFFVILCLTVFYFLKVERAKLRWTFSWPKITALVSLLIMCALNFYFAINQDIAFYKLTIYIQAIALFFLLFAIRIGFEKISWMLVLSGGVQSILAIIQFASQKVFASKWLGMAGQCPFILGTPVVETSDGRWLRAFGTFSHPNILAGFLVFAILCGIYLLINKGATSTVSGRVKMILASSIALNSVGLAFTFSRAAIIALVVALVFLTILFFKKGQCLPVDMGYDLGARRRTNFFLVAIGLIAISFLCVSLMFPNLIMTRAGGEQRLEVKSNSERIAEYKMAPALMKNYWLFGAGAGNYTLAVEKTNPNQPVFFYQPIHNAILLEIIEFGVVGILLLIVFVVFLLATTKPWRRWLDSGLARRSLGGGGSLPFIIALLLLAFFDHYLSSMYSGILLTTVVGYLILSPQQ